MALYFTFLHLSLMSDLLEDPGCLYLLLHSICCDITCQTVSGKLYCVHPRCWQSEGQITSEYYYENNVEDSGPLREFWAAQKFGTKVRLWKISKVSSGG